MNDRLIPLVTCFVPGQPKTKGSLTFKGGGYVEESVVGSTRWRELMVERIRSTYQGQPWRGPVEVHATFYLRPPVSYAHWAWAFWPRAGDVDKLTRNLLDALSVNEAEPKKGAGVYVDDNQVTKLIVEKLPAPESSPGVDLRVYGIAPSGPSLSVY